MKMTEWLRAHLDDEAPRTRRALERVPDGREDWKPHERSMAFGQLATLVATMPSWVAMIVERDELDINPPAGSSFRPPRLRTSAELVEAHDAAVSQAGAALGHTTDAHLAKPWRLLVSGTVVSEQPRHVVLRNTFMHLAHHRGQLTVYLRLNEAPVPAIYGPSADDASFG